MHAHVLGPNNRIVRTMHTLISLNLCVHTYTQIMITSIQSDALTARPFSHACNNCHTSTKICRCNFVSSLLLLLLQFFSILHSSSAHSFIISLDLSLARYQSISSCISLNANALNALDMYSFVSFKACTWFFFSWFRSRCSAPQLEKRIVANAHGATRHTNNAIQILHDHKIDMLLNKALHSLTHSTYRITARRCHRILGSDENVYVHNES